MTSQTVAPTDKRLTWLGCIGLETSNEGTIARRLPPFSRELFPSDESDALWNHAGTPTGVRIAFETDSTVIGGHYLPQTGLKPIDIFSDGELVASLSLNESDQFYVEDLPAHTKKIELWLPHSGVFTLHNLFFSPDAIITPISDTRPKWLTYGSSITQAAAANSPSTTWPAIVARNNDLNLTCLGFGGNCHLEPMVARVIREQAADYISICAGINIFRGTYAPRTFRAALIGFIQIIREKHPRTPIALISPIISPPRETVTELAPSAVGWTLPLMRAEVKAAVEALRTHGDDAIFYVDGLDILGPDEANVMPDQLHPDANGQFILAKNFNRVVVSRFLSEFPLNYQN
jgi:lysophospholipase L1-like esterase